MRAPARAEDELRASSASGINGASWSGEKMEGRRAQPRDWTVAGLLRSWACVLDGGMGDFRCVCMRDCTSSSFALRVEGGHPAIT